MSRLPISPFNSLREQKTLLWGISTVMGLGTPLSPGGFFPEVLIVLGGCDSIHAGSSPGGENLRGLVAADLNGDGRDDLVIADGGAPIAMVYLSMN